VKKKHLLWLLIPLALLAALGAGLLALPDFVSATTHRAAIESLASSLTGRQVHIGGKLSLNLLPAPELTATQITITGPDSETLQARSLALDISLPALLHGQLSATSLVLDAPVLAFPWPLPGGPRAIAPPPWLAALHAQLHNGDITLGTAHITGIDADIFTGQGGTFTVSGTGTLQGQNLSLSAALGTIALTGAAPLTLDATSGPFATHIAGNLTNTGTLEGSLTLAAKNLSATANITADGNEIAFAALHMTSGQTTVAGSAVLNLVQPALSASLTAQNLDLAQLQPWRQLWPGLPLSLILSANNVTADGRTIPALQTNLDLSASGLDIHSLQATLPGSATLNAAGQIAPSGAVSGRAILTSPSLPALLAGFALPAPSGWDAAQLSVTLAGTTRQLALTQLSGSLGPDSVTGNLVLTGPRASGTLSFDQLDLTPLIAWIAQKNALPGLTLDAQITAARATIGPLALTNLLLDGSFDGHLNLRRFSANLYHGLAAGSLALDDSGNVTAARGFLSLPSAAPLRALLPASWQPPAALVQPRLTLTLAAQGPTTALATSMVATLGDFTLTAAPVINLAQSSATGPLSLRHPSAIAAFNLFSLSQGLSWPGAGSIALRADFTASPTQFGLPDFVLSLGALTLNGQLLSNNGVLAGHLDADTLALPPIPGTLTLPWTSLATLTGKIALTANRVLYAGAPILGPSAATLTFAHNQTSLAMPRAALAGGTLSGTLTATTAATTAPALAATLTATALDTSKLALPLTFPYSLPTGILNGAATLTATGYEPRIWLATLGGAASLTASNGTLNGFNLDGLSNALTLPSRARALRAALAKGTSGFTSLTLTGTLAHGTCTLTTASLKGPSGLATATGSIDLFDNDLDLHLTLQPFVTPPLSIGTMVLGSWRAPAQYPRLGTALLWQPSPP
jgi:uncharacterized protein involved in outer membrane biogenesis